MRQVRLLAVMLAILCSSGHQCSCHFMAWREMNGVDLADGELEDDEDITGAIEQLAEMALLGSGHSAQLFPETIEEAYAAFGDEAQWRIAL